MNINKQTILVIIAVCLIIAAVSIGLFYYSTLPSQTDPVAVAPSAGPVAGENASRANGEGEATPQAEGAAAPQQPAAAQENETDAGADADADADARARAVAEITSGINLARVRPDGTAVIAGIAPPGSAITLMIGDRVIGTAVATDQGEWVIVPDEALEPGAHQIIAMTTLPDGTSSVESMALIVEVPESGDETPLVVLVPYKDDAPDDTQAGDATGDDGQAGDALVDNTQVIVIQAPDIGASEGGAGESSESGESSGSGETTESASESAESALQPAMPLVTIRTIQAFNPGYISVGGRSEGGATVRLEANGKATAPQRPSDDGRYHLGQSIDPDADKVSLRVTLLDEDGEALATARLTLTRGQIDTTLSANTLVVVRKGDALWRIAYQTYGRGIRYVDIYRENRALIRDPDLIYPDQIFVVPNS